MSPKSSERLWASPVPIPKTQTIQCYVSEDATGFFNPQHVLLLSHGKKQRQKPNTILLNHNKTCVAAVLACDDAIFSLVKQ